MVCAVFYTYIKIVLVHVLPCARAITHIKWRRLPFCHKGKEMLSLVLMRKFRLTMLKWKLSLSIHLPAWPYFSDCDTHKPNKFVMAALNSSQKLATWLLYLGKAKNEGTIDKYNFWNSYQNLYLFYQFVFIINMA